MKGVGEISMVPVAPAVANAVAHAVGVRVRELPITPDKVLGALRPGGLTPSLSRVAAAGAPGGFGSMRWVYPRGVHALLIGGPPARRRVAGVTRLPA